MPKLLFLVAEDAYFYSHRLGLGKAALQAGFQVALATRCARHKEIIEQAGIQVFPLSYFNRSSLNPLKQWLAFKELMAIYKQYQPDIVHHVAVKAVLLGTLVAKCRGVPKIINALGGLGYLFTASNNPMSLLQRFKKSILALIACKLYRKAFSQANATLLLQNSDDAQLLIAKKCVQKEKIVIIPGSGIDMNAYPMTTPPAILSPDSPVVICCVSRMLWDKGIGELIAAAEILRQQSLNFKILLYGMPDHENPASIAVENLKAWEQQGLIEWRHYCDDVAKAYAQCHIAVLPSYREGLPKSLLEAASCGRPIVTTNVPGCREVVRDGENGFLVAVRNPEQLAEKLKILIEDEPLRLRMGQQGRNRVEAYFSDEKVHSKILDLYSIQ